ncbi:MULTISPECIES: phosphatidylglycerophosphatase A [Vibrio]|uniref:Phosphatidylglycerophosphatase A n=2 Tax=Vibrio TaxID=662 RepID=A0A7X4RT41_9VIBR|nr:MULTISPECIES: phosphatidylglycerophosphatase A [Vibrio]MBF8999376.1 phosphatidylglycerophosphatase A [Vibrio nitrifigilis]MZI91674.1 phosphatidylglycerophosphatase A [Vibrio eleionomae]
MLDPKERLSLSNPWHLLATGFGSGLSPVVPGTMGTLASVPFFLLLGQLPLWLYIIVVIIASIIGIKICQITSDDMQVHDHGSIVWDEFAGFWLTMLVVPIYGISALDWHWIVSGFVLFRFFDMLKPWPICWFDKRVHGGLGIMIDDLVAGVISAICLAALGHWCGWV